MKRLLKALFLPVVLAHAADLSAQVETPLAWTPSECAAAATASGLHEGRSFAELAERRVPLDDVIRLEVSPAELDAEPIPGDRRLRVGAVKATNLRIDFSGLRAGQLTARARPHAHGAIRSNGSGGFEWTGAMRSDRATALRLHFTGFYLPRNTELYLSNDTGDVVGPYTGRGHAGDGEFWSHTLWGSQITLHLFYDGADTDRVLGAARFAIAHVGHLGGAARSVFSRPAPGEMAGGLCGGNEDCIESVETLSQLSPPKTIPANVQPALDAVALILFASGPWQYICSGGLIADTDEGSEIPLFLTANHCLSRGREAKSLQAFFQFSQGCSGPGGPTVLGSSILATNRTGDYTLLLLDEQAPEGTKTLPWSSAPIASSDGTALFRISHPSGEPQAYSEHVVNTSRTTCSSWPRGPWIYSSDVFGGTEGGSSGSPVLNAAGQIVGQLSGACGYNVNDSCDSGSNATVDGALAAYFPEVAAFLDPNTSCTDSDNDGFCAEEGDCNDLDSTVNPGVLEDCGDGIDNDCNGLTDEGDPFCETPSSCDLGAIGDSCNNDADCCSNKCRGKAGGQVCR